MKNVIVRSISGLVYIALIVGSIIWGELPFTVLCSLLAVWGVIEFTSLFDRKIIGTLAMLDCLGAVALTCLPFGYMLSAESPVILFCCLTLIPACFIIRIVTSLFDYRPTAFMAALQSMASVVYLGLPLLYLNLLYVIAGWQFVLTMFVMIWVNDTGAFCFGSLFGTHKMSPRLSPKKSWEGLIGGFACAILLGLATFYWFNASGFSLVEWMLFGLLVGVFATWGDLFESLMKRSLGIKDSGHLIPGHGGILDRIDSLLLVAPLSALFFTIAAIL